MGSIREPQPRDSRDRMDKSRPLSPRRSRVMSDRDDRTLPPISHLLPNIDSSHQGRPRSRGSNHSPPSHYPPLSSSRGSSDRSPSYRYQVPLPASSNSPVSPIHEYDRRYQGQSSHDRYDLPYHSGPPADRPPTTLSRDAYLGKPPHSSMPSNSSYATQPSSYRATAYPTHDSDTRRRDDEQRTSLPPPPPFHGSSSGHSPYSESRSQPSADGRHDHYPPPPPPPPLHQAYQHSFDAPRPYDPRMAPSARAPNGAYHQPPQYSYSSLPPLSSGHYSSADEPARKRRGNLPRWTTDIFKAWFLEHIAHPYPSEQEKNDLCAQTGCSMTQISNWFINARRRQTPVLTRQAEAERRLRDTATGRSSSNSD